MIDPITGLDVIEGVVQYLDWARIHSFADRAAFIRIIGRESRQVYARDNGWPEYRGAWHTYPPIQTPVVQQQAAPVITPEIEEADVVCNDFLVGCDPEFVVLRTDTDILHLTNLIGSAGEIGYDHGGRVGELRPEPSKNTRTLVNRMKKLILESDKGKILSGYKWRSGPLFKHVGGLETLGGHVHIDVPFGSDKADLMVPSMDKVTEWLEKLEIVPSKLSSDRRNESKFGFFGDIRDHKGHLEYRTLPSWLYDPRVAYLCLTAIKVAAAKPKESYRHLAKYKPSVGRFEDFFALAKAGIGKDKNASEAIELVRKCVGLDTEIDVKTAWKTVSI